MEGKEQKLQALRRKDYGALTGDHFSLPLCFLWKCLYDLLVCQMYLRETCCGQIWWLHCRTFSVFLNETVTGMVFSLGIFGKYSTVVWHQVQEDDMPVSSHLAWWELRGLQSEWKPQTEYTLAWPVLMYCLGSVKLWSAQRHQYLMDSKELMHMTKSLP